MAQEVQVQPKHEVASEETTRPGRVFVPHVDIADAEETLWLWADLPGVDETSLDVRLDGDVLSLEGRVRLDDYAGLEPVYTEYNVGHFERRFRVSEEIDAEGIQAKLQSGVLELRLPKAARARPRRIEVKTA